VGAAGVEEVGGGGCGRAAKWWRSNRDANDPALANKPKSAKVGALCNLQDVEWCFKVWLVNIAIYHPRVSNITRLGAGGAIVLAVGERALLPRPGDPGTSFALCMFPW
jgi:hypothetical protein